MGVLLISSPSSSASTLSPSSWASTECIGGWSGVTSKSIVKLSQRNANRRKPHLKWQRRIRDGRTDGKTLHEIIETVGLPNRYSNVGRNLLVQWSQLGINVSLLFEYKPETSAPVNISQHEVDFVCLRIIQQSSIGKIA